MKRDRSHIYLDRITDEASDWAVCLQDQALRAEERAAFAEWLEASPDHVYEYLQVVALWDDLQDLGPDPSVEELIRIAQASHDENVVPLFEPVTSEAWTPGEETAKKRKSRGWLHRVAMAAAVILVALTLGWFWLGTGPAVYRTLIGEQSSFVLSDGSVVTLNTQSEIHVHFTATHRDIDLVVGEALFDVAKDPERRFRVSVDGTTIQAIGTQFNVRHRNDDTTVTVLEGTVEMTPVEVKPDVSLNESSTVDSGRARQAVSVKVTVGQVAQVERRSGQVVVANADIEKATAWRERRLVFESCSLRDVIDEFNLYNKPPMIIGDPMLDKLQISGAFNADDRESFVLFLEETGLGMAETNRDGRTTLRGTAAAVR